MSSSIFFRFKSQKDPLQITFDGTSLSVFEVKRDIISISKLGDGTDFDLEIYSADGNNEKYDDDTSQIPRSTTVIARRLPAARQGAGKAARYVTGKMPVNAKNAHRVENMNGGGASKSAPSMSAPPLNGKPMTEEEKLNAVLDQSDQSWKEEQANSTQQRPQRSYNKSAAVPDKPLPPGYTCHRCGQKGHWIQACPTNNDPNFEGRPKFKRTTGIPRSFLKVVEKPTEVGEDGKVDISKLPHNVMYTASGEWVVAEADHATWDKIQEQHKVSAQKAKEAETGSEELQKRGLECSIDKVMFNEPTKTPCCGSTYCRDCIENTLLDNDLLCPKCGEQVLLDALEADDDMVKKIKEYQEEKAADKKEKAASKSPSAAGTPKADSPKVEDAKSPSTTAAKVDAPNSTSSSPNTKKRSAEDELPNDRRPSNPAVENARAASSQTPTPAPPTGPKAANTGRAPPTGPKADQPNQQAAFQRQMDMMAAASMGMPNGMPPAMMNPMMGPGFNPQMMNMGMGNMGNMNGMNMGPMGSMNPMMGMSGWGGQQGMGMGNGNMMGNQGQWNGQGMGMGMGMQGQQGGQQQGGGGGANESPYMRQPVNPQRQWQRQKYQRPRSQDFRQV